MPWAESPGGGQSALGAAACSRVRGGQARGGLSGTRAGRVCITTVAAASSACGTGAMCARETDSEIAAKWQHELHTLHLWTVSAGALAISSGRSGATCASISSCEACAPATAWSSPPRSCCRELADVLAWWPLSGPQKSMVAAAKPCAGIANITRHASSKRRRAIKEGIVGCGCTLRVASGPAEDCGILAAAEQRHTVRQITDLLCWTRERGVFASHPMGVLALRHSARPAAMGRAGRRRAKPPRSYIPSGQAGSISPEGVFVPARS